MINIIVGGVAYAASLVGCYDGDTCTIKFHDAPDIIATQTLRFEGFDTPEIRGKCEAEKYKAQVAKDIVLDYMESGATLYSNGDKGKYGRLLVSSPYLSTLLIDLDLAKPYDGGKRSSWCDGE